ncbi:conserved hypothetical protein [Candida dubliniensis CD36]|uniref:Uncharacterized protein n=1 Tax=Candida dubliniensis (strain CD36 / ATCC MYA-646 / CBS 7987 / NCPF 3949 / NRRL Y-17841) TaxID=573826 RepID=B9WGR4_CANDC|nr:conserved hypothetical protein [Candida dubliniensis CD36]CAX42440.1 conserved hypothetical protein [Candida dubliniensis CD36]
MKPKFVTIKLISILFLYPLDCFTAIVPFRDSIELVFTPEDIKKSTDYALWKIPAVKKNFKTTVKQKLLNRLLNKDLQEINPNPYDEELFEEEQEKVKANEISNTFQIVELDIKKPNGVMRSVLKGPSSTEKNQAKLVVQSNRNTLLKNNFKESRTGNEVKHQFQELSSEHLGYSHPRRVKNIKHDFNKMPSEIPDNTADSNSDSEEDDDHDGLQDGKTVDPFYDD